MQILSALIFTRFVCFCLVSISLGIYTNSAVGSYTCRWLLFVGAASEAFDRRARRYARIFAVEAR